MQSAGFEPAIPANKWPQTDASEQNAVRILRDGNRRDVSMCTVHVYVCHTVHRELNVM